MKRCFLSAVVLGLVGAAVAAERPLKISVTCDRAGAVYKVGETATFSVTAADAGGGAATSGTVTVVLDNFGTKVVGERTHDLAKGNPFTVRGTLDEPGFLRLSVKAEKIANPALDSEDFIWSAGFSPEKIRQKPDRPADFDAFWAEARSRLAREVPLDPRMEKDEARSAGDKQHDWYRVSFTTFGRRVYAWLAKPKGALPGARLPASVQVPGAGFGRWSTLGSATAGRITLFFSVFPFEPTTDCQRREQELIAWEKPLEAKWGMKRYCRAGIAGERREDFYYYPVILGFDRAVDWLAAQPDVDRGNIVYHGASQGGAFGLFLLALNRNFARGLVMVPAITGHFQHLDGRQDGSPRFFDNADGKYHAAIARNAPYFDGVNFAAAIRCPVRFMVGFADPICSPSAVYSAYNTCGSSDKAIVNCVGMGHHVDWNEFQKLRLWLEGGSAAACGEKVARYETSFAERPRDAEAKAVAAPKDMKLVLLLGQSNMAGRAPVPEADRRPLARALKMERDGSWVEATSPIHFDRKFAGMSPCNGFAKAYLAEHPRDTLGLVPCAVGGSSMATWIDGGEDPYGQNLRRALERAKKAQANGTFVAVLWHQGEADATAADHEKRLVAYPERFRTMAWRIRRELGNPDLPVILGEIGPFWNEVEKGVPAADLMNRVLNAIPGTLPRSACVSAKDLKPLPDGQHFDLASTETLGRRYYEAWKRLAKWGDSWQTGPVELAPSVLTLTNEARYLEWKWRVDVTDRSTGLDADGMRRAWEEIVTKRAPGESWQLVKGRIFAAGCDRAAIGVSPFDWFPAFSPWTYHRHHPIRPLLWNRAKQVDAEHEPELGGKVWAGAKEGRWSIWKDYCHSSPDWDRILKLGFPGMREELKRHWKDEPYYQARLLAAEGILRLLDRLVAQAEKTASVQQQGGRARGQLESLRRLREGPPKTAYDAMMFIYLGWVMGENFDLFQVRTLSNVDRILTPYYRADLKAGRTTEAEFREQVKHFWWQWGSIDNYWGQPVYVGGTRPDGTTEYNEVSRIILDVHDELNLPTPKLHVKIAANTPDWVWRKTVDMARRQRSVSFLGEEPIRRQMKSLGYSDEEARTAIIWGCYEWGCRDSANDTAPAYLNLLKCLEEELAGSTAGTFAEFKASLLARIDRFLDEAMELTDATERWIWDVNPSMFFSLSIGHSVETGKDAFFNGARHGNSTVILLNGLATLVDALLAVEEVVYERKEMTVGELAKLMADNWRGREDLRLRMLRSKRKWGNNDAEANALGREIAARCGKRINGHPNARGGIYRASGHSARQHIELGRRTGATPDGRKAGEEFSKNLSPTMGADTEGVTALVTTLGCLDPLDLPGDFPLDVALLPRTIEGEKGLLLMRAVIEQFFANGGVVIQFNVQDAATLRDAQRHPEKYANLQVRVCGWNVRWNDIPKVEQDKFILRQESIAQ